MLPFFEGEALPDWNVIRLTLEKGWNVVYTKMVVLCVLISQTRPCELFLEGKA